MAQQEPDSFDKIFQDEGITFGDGEEGKSSKPEPPIPLSVLVDCKHCGRTTSSVCPTCHGGFCDDHASYLDPVYCRLCLDEVGAEIKIEPLRDADGVRHQGRDMIPTGPVFATTAKRIWQMSDYELDAHIDHYKELIRQAERSLDFRRVMYASGTLEKDQRKQAKRRQLRAQSPSVGVKLPGVKTATSVASEAKRVASTSALAGDLGISQEAMLKVMAILAGKKK